MTTRLFNSNKKLIIQELESFLKELKLNCGSEYQLRFLVEHYLSYAIEDIKRVINEIED